MNGGLSSLLRSRNIAQFDNLILAISFTPDASHRVFLKGFSLLGKQSSALS